MSQIILSSLVNAVINGNAVESDAMAEFLALFKAKAAKAKAKAEFETALTAAKAKAAKPRKPRRSKVEAPKTAPTVLQSIGSAVGKPEKGLVVSMTEYRGGFKAYCAALIRNNGKSASAGSDSAFNEVLLTNGREGSAGGRMAFHAFKYHFETGKIISKEQLARLGVVTNHLHYQKVSGFLATLKK